MIILNIDINFSENMNKINGMRGRLLFEKFYQDKNISNVEMTFAGMIEKVLTVPSYSETECCTKTVKDTCIIRLNYNFLDVNLSNIQEAIVMNLIDIEPCKRCKEPMLTRNFGNHLFVEVGYETI